MYIRYIGQPNCPIVQIFLILLHVVSMSTTWLFHGLQKGNRHVSAGESTDSCISCRNTGLQKLDERIIFALSISVADPNGRAVLRHGSAAARLLRLWAWISPRTWMSVCCECCVLSEADHSECDREVPSRVTMTQNLVQALQEKYSVRKLGFMSSVRLVLFMYQLVLVSCSSLVFCTGE